jgi:signal transduction histidine kinase
VLERRSKEKVASAGGTRAAAAVEDLVRTQEEERKNLSRELHDSRAGYDETSG